MNKKSDELKVVAIGGGTGLSTMLRGLKQYTSDITAIVTVSDNGGGSGIIRQEMNIVPPGDIRNCLVALANTEPIMENLLQYRFNEGSLKGQNFGNLFLAALSDVSGSFEEAVKVTSNVLAITGKVLPVTAENVELVATFDNGVQIEGETQIVAYGKNTQSLIEKIMLKPEGPKPGEDVIKAILEADLILLGPGSLYTSIIPNLLVSQVAEAIKNAKGHRVYIANIMSQPGETTGFTVEEHIEAIEKYIGDHGIDTVVVNSATVSEAHLKRYSEDGAHILQMDDSHPLWERIICLEAPLAQVNHEKKYIRHDSLKLAEHIFHHVQYLK
ncbi:MAG: gluconeogenesis factor YvcK family protein [Cellulosilyticaceae bacterium]